jgi:hypothetical protein
MAIIEFIQQSADAKRIVFALINTDLTFDDELMYYFGDSVTRRWAGAGGGLCNKFSNIGLHYSVLKIVAAFPTGTGEAIASSGRSLPIFPSAGKMNRPGRRAVDSLFDF